MEVKNKWLKRLNPQLNEPNNEKFNKQENVIVGLKGLV